MKIYKYPEKQQWSELLARPVFETASLDETVKSVLKDIKTHGDAAVKKYTLQFDKVDIAALQVTSAEFDAAENLVSTELKNAIELAIKNIKTFHSAQMQEEKVVETMPGLICRQKSVAIEKVGLYVPGGTAPLFSTVLMLAVPAQVAGCKEIVLCTPPAKDGSIHPAILYAAKQVGVTAVFKSGGIQAIGAMAYGTESVPQVYKIFGPGNQYVTAAKQLVSRDCVAIDMPAGPSEVAVMADASCVPAFVACDLLSQAEHGTDSQSILVTDDESIIAPILKEVEIQVEASPRKQYVSESLKHSKIILVKDKNEMIEFINAYAPEHLIIATNDYQALSERIVNAGSVFLGNYTCESLGDYASGTNHTLPTNGWARSYSGVNLDAYVKKITFQELKKESIALIGPAVAAMAKAEGLHSHEQAMLLRIKN